MKGTSALAGFVTALDAAGEVDTPNGRVRLVKLVGATDRELRAVMEKRLWVEELLKRLDRLQPGPCAASRKQGAESVMRNPFTETGLQKFSGLKEPRWRGRTPLCVPGFCAPR